MQEVWVLFSRLSSLNTDRTESCQSICTKWWMACSIRTDGWFFWSLFPSGAMSTLFVEVAQVGWFCSHCKLQSWNGIKSTCSKFQVVSFHRASVLLLCSPCRQRQRGTNNVSGVRQLRQVFSTLDAASGNRNAGNSEQFEWLIFLIFFFKCRHLAHANIPLLWGRFQLKAYTNAPHLSFFFFLERGVSPEYNLV